MTEGGLVSPPLVPGLPLLGNALSMAGDIQQFLVRMYRQHGPAFRVRALNQSFVVLAGPDANALLRDRGDELFSSEETMGGLNREFAMRVYVLRGQPHRHLRKVLATGLSRDLLDARWADFMTETDRVLAQWASRPRLNVVTECQRLAAAQLSITLTATSTADRFSDLRYAFELMLDATLAGKWPPLVLRWPAYRRARERILGFASASLAERAAWPTGGAPDLIDRALAAVDENGHPHPAEVRAGMAMQGYFAGINTGAYHYSFMLYALLRHADVRARVSAEVDRLAQQHGQLRFEHLRDLPALHGLALETLWMYPSAPASSRTVPKPFVFHGHRIDAGRRVLVATTVPHHLPGLERVRPRRVRHPHRRGTGHLPPHGRGAAPGAGPDHRGLLPHGARYCGQTPAPPRGHDWQLAD